MQKPAATIQQDRTEIKQLSQAELVDLVLELKKIIEELPEKLAIATGKSRTNSKTSSQPPALDLIQKSQGNRTRFVTNGSQKKGNVLK